MEAPDWDTLTTICDLSLPELPADTSAEEQVCFLHDYLARVRAATRSACYTYVEPKGAASEAAEASPVLLV
jgi:hypothetical protein